MGYADASGGQSYLCRALEVGPGCLRCLVGIGLAQAKKIKIIDYAKVLMHLSFHDHFGFSGGTKPEGQKEPISPTSQATADREL